MELEIWKDIPWHGWLYQASSLWRLRSFKNWRYWFWKERILKLHSDPYWYLQTWIWRAHRLVAAAFHGLDLNDPKQLACHRDDIPTNNREDNIFVGSHKDNTQDMIKKGRRILITKSVLQFSKTWGFIKEWISSKDASIKLWVNHSNISQCCIWWKYRNTAWGFIWKFK